MAQLLERVNTVELLEKLYQNVRMAADSISAILPHVEDERLLSDLTVELSCFEEYARRALHELKARDAEPKEKPLFSKVGVKLGTFVNTLVDSSADHLAEMMIKGATMGISDLCRQVRAAKENGIDAGTRSLLEEVLRYEESVVEEMKSYLR